MPRRYVLVVIDSPPELHLQDSWSNPSIVVDAMVAYTPFGYSNVRAREVTHVVEECAGDLEVLSNPDDTTKLLGEAIEALS